MEPVRSSRDCKKCGEEKDFSHFHKHPKCKYGYNSVCNECRVGISKEQYSRIDPVSRMYDRAKSRAVLKGQEFTITKEDIVIPDVCPVFGVPMKKNTKYAPSLDRTDSSKGYVPGNVRVISLRANILKNDATADELQLILKYVRCCEII